MRFTNDASRKLTRFVDMKFEQSDLELRRRFRERMVAQRELERLAHHTGIKDERLVNRLWQAGLREENVDALTLLPLAVAAWANGSVTAEERNIAESAISDSEIADNTAAIAVFRGWLRDRPAPSLWQLWHDFTVSRSTVLGNSWAKRTGHAILGLANRVATASGGFFGMGAICPAKREVLKKIRTVHAL